jgi:hypothetical protein
VTKEIREFSSASEFIAALHPSKWPGALNKWPSDGWIFRGHADAAWPLLPNALRDETWKADGDWRVFSPYAPSTSTELDRCRHETRILEAFGEQVDRAGLPLPPVAEPGAVVLATVENSGHAFRLWGSRTLAALAQHHGIPTRLFDFSERGLAAAYFAALEPSSGPADQLCVWAARRKLVDAGPFGGDGFVRVVRAPRASNPNLHAQSGVFAFWSALRDQLLTLEDVLEEVPADGMEPRLVQLILHRKHATDLLRRLRDEGVTAMSLFPGVDGVVRLLKEFGREVEDP